LKPKLFDAHLHIIDSRFSLTPNNGYLPDEFNCSDYLQRMAPYQLLGGAIVSGSFQAFDQTYLVAALREMGPSFVGVTQLPPSATDEEVLSLHAAGVRAVRFNLKRGGSAEIDQLDRMAHRFYDLASWHVELYADSTDLPELFNTLNSLPVVSIDHLGLSRMGFPTLLQLAERGIRVKATGFGRVNFDVRVALQQLYAANPDSLMFGTDLPSTRAPRPYRDEDIALVGDVLGEEGIRKVLYENAIALYRPAQMPD